MFAFTTDRFEFPLPEGHRFPAEKYSMLRRRVARDIPQIRLCTAHAADDEILALAHEKDYVCRVVENRLTIHEQREIGLPWSPGLVERARRSVSATIAACHAALRDGVAVNLAGGTHHASASAGSGYCIFNDVAVAARCMQMRAHGPGVRIAIVDLDVHQGDGTAQIFSNDSSVFTFSIHCNENFPFRKSVSDLDVGLPAGTEDAVYADALMFGLTEMHRRFVPELIVYLAGADVFEDDRLGRLRLTRSGIAGRDRRVLGDAFARAIPVAIVMAGGYGRRLEDTIDIQAATVSIAFEHWQLWRSRCACAQATVPSG